MKRRGTRVFAAIFWMATFGLVAVDWVRTAARCETPLIQLLAKPQGAERCAVWPR